MKEQDSIRKTTLIWAAFMLGFMAIAFSIAAIVIAITTHVQQI